ncbi:nucleotide exchange factor GrpE [Coprobacter sp.]
MSDKKNKKKEIRDEEPRTQSTENPTVTSEASIEDNLPEMEEQVSETDSLTAEIETLKAQNEQLSKDKLLLMADFENYRKRTLREKADLIKSGGEDCLKRILPLVDDFERGLLAIGESNDVEAVKEGMTLIYNKFKTFLEQHGIKEIPVKNEDFNTEFHEAVTTFPAPSPEMKGKVIDCVQKGYTMNDKVIRFAKVVVGE